MKKVLFPIVLVSASFLNAGIEEVKGSAQSYNTAYKAFKALPEATEYRIAMGALKGLYMQNSLRVTDGKIAKKVAEWQKKGIPTDARTFRALTPGEASQVIKRFEAAHKAISGIDQYQALRKAKKAFRKEALAYVKENGWEGLADQLSTISEKMSRKVIEWEKKNK